jgi:predicted RND superfamily exporter protein
MKNFLLNYSLNHPKRVFIFTLILTLGIGAFIPKIIIDTDPENMLPATQPERMFHNMVKKQFNLYDSIVVGAVNQSEQGIFNPKSLKAIEDLTRGILDIDGVVDIDLMSLANVDNISQEDGSIRFEWLMKSAPEDQVAASDISTKVDRLPLLQNTLVSEDNKATAIYVPIKDKNESFRISNEIQQLINALDSDDNYHITGLPVAEDTFGFQMFVQMGISAPLAALMIFILMWVFFRNFKFISAPMIVAMATVIITMGLFIGSGFTVHIMSSMIPIFLMPIAVVDSIHIMSEFSDNYEESQNRRDVLKKVIGHLFIPMFYTSITSAIGFASLMLTPIPPVQIFGAFVAFGILLAFFLTIIFIPAYLIILKPQSLASLKTKSTESQDSVLQKTLKSWGAKSIQHSKSVVLIFVAVFAVSLWGVSKIEINDNPVRWFKQDHKIRVADTVLNQHFAGTYDAFLVFELDSGSIKKSFYDKLNIYSDSEIVKSIKNSFSESSDFVSQINQALITLEDAIFDADEVEGEKLQKVLELIEETKIQLAYFQQPKALKMIEEVQTSLVQSGYVGKSNSITDVVKTVNRELHSGNQDDYRIPSTQNGVSQTLLQYQSSHRPGDLWHMVTKDYSNTAIWIQLKSGDNQDMTQVVEYVDNYFSLHPLPETVNAKWAGKTYLNKVWQEEMVAGMVSSLASAFVVVFIMMIVLFRSFVFGILAMLPLTITISFIYGLIGWVGKDYDMPIAVLSALTLGLSVDFAIHFLERAREIYRQTNDFKNTMEQMFSEPASAISRNAIVIAIGFTPLLFAPLMPYITVGFFLASIMAVSALVTLLLLPSVMSLIKRVIFKHG